MSGIDIVCVPSHLGLTEVRLTEGVVPFEVVVSNVVGSIGKVEVELWFSSGGCEWSSESFTGCTAGSDDEDDKDDKDDDEENERTTSHLFQLAYNPKEATHLDFTIRYRLSDQDDWSWLSSAGNNGTLLLLDDSTIDLQVRGSSFTELFEHADPGLGIQPVNSSVPGTSLQIVSAAAAAQAPELTEATLGKPKDLLQWISLERLMSYWMEPNQGGQILNTPRDSLLVAYQRIDGSHVVLLPISGMRNECIVHLRSDKTNGNLVMHIKNDGGQPAKGQVVVGHGATLATTVDAAFAQVRSMFQHDYAMTAEDCQEVKPVDPKWFEEWTDGLFYCSWNAMYTDVNEDKLIEALDGLHKLGVRVTGVIIDDGWQDVDDKRRWKSFRPPKDKFPNGLAGFVKEIKTRYPYIKHVGVWHALMGYWNGFAPDSWIDENYALKAVDMRAATLSNGLGGIHIVQGHDVRRMYDDFYRYLQGEGITVVKCDVQATPDNISQSQPVQRRVWRDYQDAFRLASLRYFDRRVIYCMSHVADIFLYALLQKNAAPACVRNSNDFFPDQPKSHAWHIFWNANNALYTSRLNCMPDWDMFDTTHPQAEFHAKSRSLSGGPILITDQVGKSDVALVRAMTSTNISTGDIRVLRFPNPAASRYPYLNFHDGRFTKVINKTYDIYTVGAFNTIARDASEGITLDDFTPLPLPKDEYVVFELSTRRTRRMLAKSRFKHLFTADLKENQSDIYTASPVLSLAESKNCAVLGLVDKFAGSVAVGWYRTNHSAHPILELQITHLGLLGIYLDFVPNVKHLLVTCREVVVPKETVRWQDGMLQVDVLTAWQELGLGGWSNELNVKIYFRD